jgi:hypothetical protein
MTAGRLIRGAGRPQRVVVNNDSMWLSLVARAGLPENAALAEVVAAVHSMPYGRPAERSAAGALTEWRGTCSTKHALLAAVLAEHWPHTEPRLVHRVYRPATRRAAGRAVVVDDQG